MDSNQAESLALVVDVLVTWIGAVALARYTWVLDGTVARSPLERRARFLLGAMAMLLFVRGFSWLVPESRVLALLTFLPVSLLPVAMTVFAEGLVRRHAPRWIKWLAAASTVVAFIANLLRLVTHDPRDFSMIGFVVLGGLVVTLAALGVMLARTDRASLSRSENALIRVCAVVAVIALPLAVTDFRFDLGAPVVRMGTLGALTFCYSLLRRPQENTVTRWLADVGRLVARALLITGLIAVALRTFEGDVLVPFAVLAAALVLAFSVWDRLRRVESRGGENDLLAWLAREPPATAAHYAAELRTLPLTADAVVVEGEALARYDAANVARAFLPGSVVTSLSRLRMLRESDSPRARGADELADLLERHAATHVGLLSARPLRLLLVTSPELGGDPDVDLVLSTVVRRWPRADADSSARR